MFEKKKAPKAPEKVSEKVSEPELPTIDEIQPTPSPAAVASVPSQPVSRTSAMIGSSITIKGDITGDENLLIEGKVEGTVNLGSKNLTVGQSGQVNANVNAKEIKVEGEIIGDIAGNEIVVVSKTGKVQGNIVAPRVTLEDGANFKGRIDMDPTEQPVQKAPLKTVKTLDSTEKMLAEMENSHLKISDKIG